MPALVHAETRVDDHLQMEGRGCVLSSLGRAPALVHPEILVDDHLQMEGQGCVLSSLGLTVLVPPFFSMLLSFLNNDQLAI